MKCPGCGHSNPSTVGFCVRCGGKMDLTADEIHDALVQKARVEIVESSEFYAKQSLVFSIVLALVMITLLVLATGAPEDAYFMPSASGTAKYLKADHRPDLGLQQLVIPLEARKRR